MHNVTILGEIHLSAERSDRLLPAAPGEIRWRTVCGLPVPTIIPVKVDGPPRLLPPPPPQPEATCITCRARVTEATLRVLEWQVCSTCKGSGDAAQDPWRGPSPCATCRGEGVAMLESDIYSAEISRTQTYASTHKFSGDWPKVKP